MNREPNNPIRLGMVGGGADAFIGAVHRTAARLDGRFTLLAGALSSTPEKALRSAEAIGLPRAYGSWQAMLEEELKLPEEQRIEAVSIVTPNHLHHEVAMAFVQAGFHVVTDKPMVTSIKQADELVRAVDAAGVVFGVTYNYTGYPMVRQAREMIARGELGTVRKVVVQYHQGWLANAAEADGVKQAEWRTDPARSGVAGAMGDIGSHAENLVSTVTGLKVSEVAADLTTFVPGRQLDDDASVLLRFEGGARGALLVSQVEVGEENGLSLRVYGTHGGLVWRQEQPNRLEFKSNDAPLRVFTRGGPGLHAPAVDAARIPPGHPEGFHEAFANIYSGVADAIRGGVGDHPTVHDGYQGVAFIETVVASSRSSEKWTTFPTALE
jgi:predicted dehydrogenase